MFGELESVATRAVETARASVVGRVELLELLEHVAAHDSGETQSAPDAVELAGLALAGLLELGADGSCWPAYAATLSATGRELLEELRAQVADDARAVELAAILARVADPRGVVSPEELAELVSLGWVRVEQVPSAGPYLWRAVPSALGAELSAQVERDALALELRDGRSALRIRRELAG